MDSIEALFHKEASPQIMQGSIGWEDEEEYAFLGTDENDGHTLVRVQLFEGRDHTKPLNPKRAQGHKIICHLSGLLGHRVPPKDTRCMVACAPGMDNVPGGGIIIATVEKSNPDQFQKDRAVLDYGDQHVIIKGKSVTIQDQENRFIAVGTPRSGGDPGLTFQDADGTGGMIQQGAVCWFAAAGGETKSLLFLSEGKAQILVKDQGFLSIDSSQALLQHKVAWVNGSVVYLGKSPDATSPVQWGVTGPGAPSPCVFVSKV